MFCLATFSIVDHFTETFGNVLVKYIYKQTILIIIYSSIPIACIQMNEAILSYCLKYNTLNLLISFSPTMSLTYHTVYNSSYF